MLAGTKKWNVVSTMETSIAELIQIAAELSYALPLMFCEF